METLNLITSRCHAMLCCLQAQAIRSMSLIQSLILYYCASQNDLKAAFPPRELLVKHTLARWLPKAFHYTCTVCINKCSLVLGRIMRLFHRDR